MNSLNEAIGVFTAFTSEMPAVERAGEMIVSCLKSGGKVLTCGNGGSACDALHLAEELTGRFKADRRSLPGIALCADVGALTCIGNDYGFDKIFSRQVEGLGKSGDVLVGFTTSGNSRNVLAAFAAAKAMGITTVMVAGGTGGAGKGTCDVEIIVPSGSTARIQEVHTFVLHRCLEIVETHAW